MGLRRWCRGVWGESTAPEAFLACTDACAAAREWACWPKLFFPLQIHTLYVELSHLSALPPSFIFTPPPSRTDVGSMSDEPRKRSRFDQTEPEPARKSRFDRRSRSPGARKDSESHRSRSPIKSDGRLDSSAGDKKNAAAAAAAAAAAKINASISAKKGIQHVDVPPIRAVCELENTLN